MVGSRLTPLRITGSSPATHTDAGSIPVNRDAVDKFDSYKASGHWYVSRKWGSAVSLFLNREN